MYNIRHIHCFFRQILHRMSSFYNNQFSNFLPNRYGTKYVVYHYVPKSVSHDLKLFQNHKDEVFLKNLPSMVANYSLDQDDLLLTSSHVFIKNKKDSVLYKTENLYKRIPPRPFLNSYIASENLSIPNPLDIKLTSLNYDDMRYDIEKLIEDKNMVGISGVELSENSKRIYGTDFEYLANRWGLLNSKNNLQNLECSGYINENYSDKFTFIKPFLEVQKTLDSLRMEIMTAYHEPVYYWWSLINAVAVIKTMKKRLGRKKFRLQMIDDIQAITWISCFLEQSRVTMHSFMESTKPVLQSYNLGTEFLLNYIDTTSIETGNCVICGKIFEKKRKTKTLCTNTGMCSKKKSKIEKEFNVKIKSFEQYLELSEKNASIQKSR
jgi:hypothetical protein